MVDRAQILQAVRFQAAQNGGVPLGKRKFEEVTGWSQSVWFGKYWARWNDVLVEAGFEPNQWNPLIHEREALLKRLAEFAVELGHYPTIAERNLRHRTDPTMPFDSTFLKFLGSKSEQVGLLMEFAVANPEFREVYDICAPLVEAMAGKSAALSPRPSAPGRVYIMYSHTLKLYKVGKTDNLTSRLSQIRSDVSGQVDLIHELRTDDPTGIERYWHNRFTGEWSHLEWYNLSVGDVEAFKSRGESM